jgi:two-component system, LuxR family, sensor kinase FixL
LAQLCREVWLNLEAQWRDKEIQLVLEGGETDVVYCDAHRIRQVYRNIFENSLAVSPNRSTIHVHLESVQVDQDWFQRVRIADQGPGLNSEQKEKIFEPFYTTKTKGTGLGMAICQRILEAHGGRIYVLDSGQSPPSDQATTGATIVFEIPSVAS